MYIRFCGNAYLGFRPYGESLSKSPEADPVESNQSAPAPPLGASPRLGMPGSPGRTSVRSVGAKLARDSGLSGNINVECAAIFASKPAPTLFLRHAQKPTFTAAPCGSEPARDSGGADA
ncbi:hypothetical protein EMIT043CA1_240057 [Pseudomonas brassicacearum]